MSPRRRLPSRFVQLASQVRARRSAKQRVLFPSAVAASPPVSPSFPTNAGYKRTSDSPLFPSTVAVTPERLSLILAVPPSINHQYATVKGRRLLSSASRSYKAHVGRQVWVALAQSPHRAPLMKQFQSKPLALSIYFYFTTPLRRDVDGGLKITQDAICEGLGINDNRIVETHLYKRVDKHHPRIEVCLTTADSPSPI
ncbi:MAG: RusA family crossover junction endodeoxyribonuclease [Nitrospira sp.]|nr:RusA family crossover junction endodeoxyribonuclease [Nitrospira sp.]